MLTRTRANLLRARTWLLFKGRRFWLQTNDVFVRR
ncbi:hypothetical protein ACVIGA_005090 [Bradyrhizobium sp. USDA 3240]